MVIPPQINKYYISDLAPGRSFVEHTVAGGIPYFAVSWRNPTPAQRDWDLAAYVSACKEAVEIVRHQRDRRRQPRRHVRRRHHAGLPARAPGGDRRGAGQLGHLHGRGARHRGRVHRRLLTSKASIEAARSARSAGACSTAATSEDVRLAAAQRPRLELLGQQLPARPEPARDILFWNADTTNLPAALHSDFLDLLDSNGLAEPGSVEVLGTPVDLGKVRCDAFVVAGATDHIIPWTGAYRTTQMLGDSEFVLGSSGHIQAIVNPPGSPVRFLTRPGPPPPDPHEWRAGATTNEGSWWDHWLGWLGERSGERRAPTRLGNRRHPRSSPRPAGTSTCDPPRPRGGPAPHVRRGRRPPPAGVGPG